MVCVCLCFDQVYRGHCICRVASVTSEVCHSISRPLEIQSSLPQKCSIRVGSKEKDSCSTRHTDHKCSMVGSDYQYPSGGIQSSVTKFRFENNRPAEVCEEWYYIVHYLKTAVNDVELSLKHDFGISSAEDLDGLSRYARPYHYTADDIVDIRRLHSPEESIYSRSTVYDADISETCAHVSTMSQQACEKSTVDNSANVFHLPSIGNMGNSLDKFLASTALAVCDLIQFQCNCSVSQDLMQHGGPSELLPYLDAKTFYSGLLSRLNQSHNSYLLHCDNVSRQLVLDSFGLLHVESSQNSHLFSTGTSSDLTPGGNGDKEKLPNVDQLRAIQDNLAYNVCYTLWLFSYWFVQMNYIHFDPWSLRSFFEGLK